MIFLSGESAVKLRKKRSRDVDMINGPIMSRLIVYVVPLMLSNILQLLFNTADVVVVGRYASDGEKALAAVGSTGSLTSLIIGLFIGVSVGSCVVLSYKLGAGQEEGASKVVHTSMLLGLYSGLFLGVVGIVFAPQFLIWMSTPDDVLEWSVLYMRIYFIGLPMQMVYNFGSAIMRAKGDTQYPLVVLFFSGVVNIILNLVTVIGFHMDVAGVAIATIASQTVSAVLVTAHLMKSEDCCRFSFSKLKIDKYAAIEISKVGIPAGLQSIVFSISNVILQSSVNFLGKTAMAGNTAASNIDGYLYNACNAVYHGSLAFTGQNLGAGKTDRIKKVCLYSVILCTAIGLSLGVIAMIFHEPLLSLFAPGADKAAVRAMGYERLKATALTYFLCGLMEVSCGMIRGMGNSTVPMIISVIGSCLLRIVCIKWLFSGFESLQNMFCLYLVYPVSWIVTMAAEFIAFAIIFRKYINTHKTEPEKV